VTSLIIWLATIAISVSLLVILTGAEMPFVHAFVCVAVNAVFVFMASRENGIWQARGASEAEVAVLNARYIAIVWAWAALAIAAMYILVLDWHEWWRFVVGFAAAAVASLVLVSLISKAEGDPARVAKYLNFARWLTWGQLIGMIALVVGLVLDSKMDKLGIMPLGPRGNPPQDWGASNVFFFGGLALAALSWLAITYGKKARG